jgi:phosphopantothenoylcysteine synthetase/decarboxylase
LENKGCDWIVANKVTAQSNNMGGGENEVIIKKKNEEIKVPRQSKEGIAKLICRKIVEEFSG